MMDGTIIKSVSFSQKEILENVIALHTGPIEADVTFGKGGFYRGEEGPPLRFDLNPQAPGVIKADCRHLPLRDASISCLAFDPPFTGAGTVASSAIKSRYGNSPSGIPDLWLFYFQALQEFHRVVKPKGWVIFKCQDAVESGKNYFSHVQIAVQAVTVGFIPKDLFLLLAKSRMPTWHMQKQRHARKFHSYFWIFKNT
jgi:hypothetical protein